MHTKHSLAAFSTEPGDVEPPYIQHKGRRDYRRSFKLQVVRECMVPGASVSVVARRHNINTNVIFRWRGEFERGNLNPGGLPSEPPDGFIAVGVIGKDGRLVKTAAAEKPAPQTLPTVAHAKNAPLPRIEVELSNGMKVRFDAGVDRDSMRRVLAVAKEFA